MKKLLVIVLALTLVLCAACGKPAAQESQSSPEVTDSAAPSEAAPQESNPAESSPQESEQTEQSPEAPAEVIDKDREGNSITLPESIEKVISIGPSNTELLVALGCSDKIIAIDNYSWNVEGLNPELPQFEMYAPDGEQMVALDPDILFITGMSKSMGDDPFKVVGDAGICVIYIPSSGSIAEIIEDIRFVAAVMSEAEKGEDIIETMQSEIESVRKIGETITEKKTVYFEIEAAPYMYSFGKGVFLDELLSIIGAQNIMGDRESWISVTDEAIMDANPDVILTNVSYIEDAVGEIMARPGWDALTAVQNDEVYYIDADSSSRPNHNIVKALNEMAAAIYPDKY